MPLFNYTTNIPFEDNSPSQDQPDMKRNTNSTSSILNVDMIGFNTADGGYHSQLTFVDQSADPGSASNQYREYSKIVSGSSELFAQKDAAVAPIQLTRGVPVGGTTGYTYLPGGMLLQWGTASISGSSGTFTFPIPFTTLYSAVLGPNQGATMWISSSNPSSVTVSRSGSGGSSCWVWVIGV